MPFAAGVVLTSHPDLLESTFGTQTPYMPRIPGSTQADNFKLSTQWSRRMNSFKLYLTLRIHGRKAYEDLIDHQMSLATAFAERIRSSEHFELAAPMKLPILNLRLKSKGASPEKLDAAHQAIVDEVTRSGERWISLTRVRGRSVIRMMIISYLTERSHLDALWNALESAARQVSNMAD